MNNPIEHLTGAQRVRRRPAVLFGSGGSEGVMNVLDTLLAVMASECRQGYASKLVFTQYADGSMELQDNGRGLYLGSGKPEDDPIWKSKFCEFLCGSAYPDHIDRSFEYSYFEEAGKIPCREYESELYSDLDLCAVQYVSEFMDVTVCRDGLELTLHFESGENVGGITSRASDAATGTKIRFKPDDSVFTSVAIPETFIPEQLRKLALLMPDCTFCYRKECAAGMEEQVFCFPTGMVGYVEAMGSKALSTPVYTAQIAATGQDRYNRPRYGASIQIALCFIKDRGHQQIFHNYRSLSLGGTHVEAILAEVTDRLQWQLECEIPQSIVAQHLCLTVHSTTTPYASDWVNGRRNAIRNTMITHMAQDCVKDNFSHFIKTHLAEIRQVFGIMSLK